MKLIFKILKILLVVLVVLALSKDFLVMQGVKVGAKAVLGVDAQMTKFHIGLFDQKIDIRDFKLGNPEGFVDDTLIDLPRVTVEYNLLALLKGKIHLKKLVLDFKEVVVIKNKEGLSNLDELKFAKQAKEAKEQPKEEAPKEEKKKKPAKEMELQIDYVYLTIPKIVMKDYTKGEEPDVKFFDVGIKDKEYKNIKSAEQLATLIFSSAIKGTVIKSAAMYGAATVLGAGFLPAGVAGVLLSKDSVTMELDVSIAQAFSTANQVIETMKGTGIKLDKDKGEITAKVDGAKVKVTIGENDNKKTEVSVSARKMMIPKKQMAEKVLYNIKEVLEK